MTNLTLLELTAIAVALDEEGAERKRRRWAVHPAWRKREREGEEAVMVAYSHTRHLEDVWKTVLLF